MKKEVNMYKHQKFEGRDMSRYRSTFRLCLLLLLVLKSYLTDYNRVILVRK